MRVWLRDTIRVKGGVAVAALKSWSPHSHSPSALLIQMIPTRVVATILLLTVEAPVVKGSSTNWPVSTRRMAS